MIYPVDSAIHLLKNWELLEKRKKHLFSSFCVYMLLQGRQVDVLIAWYTEKNGFFRTYCLFDVLVAVAVAVAVAFVIKLSKVSKYQKNLYSADSILYRICATVCHKNQSC